MKAKVKTLEEIKALPNASISSTGHIVFSDSASIYGYVFNTMMFCYCGKEVELHKSSIPHYDYMHSDKITGTWHFKKEWLVFDDNTSQPTVPTSNCSHHRKKVVDMVFSSFWYCPDCKCDLGNARK